MKPKSLARNAVFNFLYTGTNVMFPLIVAPYVSRVLGATNLGQVEFAKAIVNWFLIFATFGTSVYGVREISRNRDDKNKVSNIFSELVVINGLFSLVIAIIYLFVVFQFEQFSREQLLFSVFSVSIFLNMFNIDWFYQGIEEYSYITIRNLIIKLFSVVAIFLFVKQKENYLLYGIISVLGMSISGILNFAYSRKFTKFSFSKLNPIRHIKKLSVFFSIHLISSIYTSFDQTLLGVFVGVESVAYMTRTKSVTNTAFSISTAISGAAMPRAAYYLKNNIKKYNELIVVVPNFILWITLPLTIGISKYSSNIMYFFGGDDFVPASGLLKIVALIIIFAPLSEYLQTQILVPCGKEKAGLLCAFFCSIVSVCLNFYLIPKYGFMGAGLAIVIVEATSFVSRYLIIKVILKDIKVCLVNKSTKLYVLSSVVMSFVLWITSNLISGIYQELIVGMLVGMLSYVIILLCFKEDVTVLLLNKALSLFKNRK